MKHRFTLAFEMRDFEVEEIGIKRLTREIADLMAQQATLMRTSDTINAEGTHTTQSGCTYSWTYTNEETHQ